MELNEEGRKRGKEKKKEGRKRGREGRKEEEEKKNRTEQSLLSQLPVVSCLLGTWRYAFHFKTHLGLQLRKQLASL